MEQTTEGPEAFRPSLDDALIERYVIGDCSDAERETVEAWIRQRSSDGNVVRWLHGRLQDPVVHVLSRASVDRAHARFLERIDRRAASAETSLSTVRESAGRGLPTPGFVRTAAIVKTFAAGALTLMLMLGMGVYFGAFGSRSTPLLTRTYATAAGEQTTVHLPDGTRAILAPYTTLVIRAFGNGHRNVQLTGQAYFEVPSNASSPFVVRTGAIATKVLGTTFIVRHYKNDRDVVVAVRSGKVSSGRHKPFILSENMVAHITDSTAMISTDADLSEYTEWTKGRLVFHMTPVSQVLAAVGHWYGYDLQLSDSSLAQEPVVTMVNGHSAPDAFATLRSLLNVDMTFNGHVVTLHPKRHSSPPPRNRGDVQDSFPPLSEVGR